MRLFRFYGLLLGLLLSTGCSLLHRLRPDPAPVPELPPPPVPTADLPTPPTAARDLADAMTTVLHLRPEQTTRVRGILAATVEQANAARQQYPAPSPTLTAALRRINAASEGQLRQALGPAAYKELQIKRPQIQALMQQRP